MLLCCVVLQRGCVVCRSDYSYTPSPQPMESNLLGSSHPPRRANSTMSIAKGLHGKEQRRASVLSDTAKFEEEEFVPSHITMVSVLSRQQSPGMLASHYCRQTSSFCCTGQIAVLIPVTSDIHILLHSQ